MERPLWIRKSARMLTGKLRLAQLFAGRVSFHRIIDASVVAMSLGVGAIRAPAASSARIFSAAVPLPPAMIAPA
jgi:hypothetical protein